MYGGPMTYRAVPLASLPAGLTLPPDSVIEAVAIDGFAAQLTDASKVIKWVAIEPADRPWPKISSKEQSAGPFYIVWTGPEAANIRSEYWAYQAAKLVSQLSPAARWPALAVDAGLPATDPIRAGQTLYFAQCLPCHKLNGAGSSDVGPNLNRTRQNP
jgi:hypothetical protein